MPQEAWERGLVTSPNREKGVLALIMSLLHWEATVRNLYGSSTVKKKYIVFLTAYESTSLLLRLKVLLARITGKNDHSLGNRDREDIEADVQ